MSVSLVMTKFEPRKCEYCGTYFEPTTGSAKYCEEHRRGSWERNNPEQAAEKNRQTQARFRSGETSDRELGSRGTKLVDGKRIPIEDVDPAVLAELAAAKLERRRESKRAYKARQRETREQGS